MKRLRFLIGFIAVFSLWAGVNYRILLVESDYRDLAQFQEDLYQFLEASAFKFDVLEPGEEITESSLIKGRDLNYSTVIILRRASELYPSEKEALKKASREGLSILSFIDVVEDSPFYKEIFGIKSLGPWETAGNIRVRPTGGFITQGIVNEKIKKSRIRHLKLEKTCEVYAASGANVPVISGCQYGKGINYLFNLDKDSPHWWWSEYDRSLKDPRLVLLRRAIIENSGLGFVYYDLSHTVILRVDDLLMHRHVWGEPIKQDWFPLVERRLSREELNDIGDIYEKHRAHVTFLVVPGFVDPGPEKGTLLINGKPPATRGCGMVFDARDVTFHVTAGWNAGDTYDYPPEYRGLLDLLDRGLIDIQEHGYTHINWRRDLWCADPNRGYEFMIWEREFADLVNHEPVPRQVQANILYEGFTKLKNWFGHEPIALIPPGHAHDETTLEVSHDFGVRLFSVGWLGIWKDWGYEKNRQIPSLFVNYLHWEPPESLKWHIAATPYLVYCHDWDLILRGEEWLDEFLTRWEEALDVRHFISLSQFAGYYFSRLSGSYNGKSFHIEVNMAGTGGPHDYPEDRFFSSHFLTVYIHPPRGLWRRYKYFPGMDKVLFDSPSVEKAYAKDGEIVVKFKPFGPSATARADIFVGNPRW